MKILKYSIGFLFLVCFHACNKQESIQSSDVVATYRGFVSLKDTEMPFLFELKAENEQLTGHLINGEERIFLDDITLHEDSIFIPMHIFDASLIAKIDGDRMQGKFVKHFEDDYQLKFRAEKGAESRFPKKDESASVDLSGKYELLFHQAEGNLEAVAIFRQKGDQLSGTIMTATGDYRYLAGHVFGSKFEMSTFDGDNSYLINGELVAEKQLKGTFWSGKSRKDQWTAVANPNAELADAGQLTYLKDGYDRLDFSFPDLNKNKVSLSDPAFENKVVIVQIFGTWCPNCMDETRFLAPWYRANKARGVEIVALSFEQKDDFEYAKKRIERMKEKLDVDYTFLVAGTADKENASEAMPMLNHIMSFPTTLFIDKKGEVRKIHTGFSGPSTGQAYDDFVMEFNATIDQLLSE